MNKILISPGRYIQGPGSIGEIGKYIENLGAKALILGGNTGLNSVKSALEKSLTEHSISFDFEVFNGECSRHEIERITEIVKDLQPDVIIGVGGGKALDTAKATGYYTKLPVAIVPTIAATDAPCSAVSVIYSSEGVFESCLLLPKNPDLVLVDTAIVAKAPVRLLVSGMGDALATWFEADACTKAFARNVPGGKATATALSLARLCYDLLIEYGYAAKLAVEKGVATEAVEKVVEANTLLSGIGFESAGLAAAHAVHNGLTVLEETHNSYHGEKVAFGTLVQMVMENRSNAEMQEVLSFCDKVGLPITLADIGLKQIAGSHIMQVAEAACSPEESIHNEPFPVTPDMVYAAIIAADAMGTSYKNKKMVDAETK